MRNIADLFRIPETRNIQELDAVSTSILHSRIINSKTFLKRVYLDFYREIKDSIHPGKEALVEIGSGGGIAKEVITNAITSDVVDLPGIDKVFPAEDMPFEDCAIDGFFMIDVFHHIKDIPGFLNEAARCLKKGGKLVMIEPAITPWSKFVYRYFHHERVDLAGGWRQKDSGRLSVANLAMPWIVFYRDREIFDKAYPSLKIRKLAPHTPFRYILSGGLSFRQMIPSFTYGSIALLEKLLSPFNFLSAMFLTIEIEKV